ncbi:MAG: hypothetical protein WC503_04775 [Candidatus Shapirobacteria bacterium]
MVNFEDFFHKLITNPSTSTTIVINGEAKKLKALSRLTSVNYQSEIGDYYKLVLSDESLLIIVPQDKSVQYAKRELGKAEGIEDSDIGKEELIYKNKKYKLVNGNDYQFVLQKIVGGLLDMEGECKFSDYVNIDDSDDFLSVGWLSYNNHRADVNAFTISIDNLNIIN